MLGVRAEEIEALVALLRAAPDLRILDLRTYVAVIQPGAGGGSVYYNGTACPTDSVAVYGTTTGDAASTWFRG